MTPLKLVTAAVSTAAIATVLPIAPAGASTVPASSPGAVRHTTAVCHYRVAGVRPGHHLNVRSGPAVHYRKIAAFRAHAWLSGSCHTRHHGWVRVVLNHGHGWVSRHYLVRR